jgi:hypothetical protein
MRRKGSWIQTYTGKQFWPLDPRAEDIELEDIAHALSNQCRFSGHTEKFYSVAEHSVNTCAVAGEYLKCLTDERKWALLHDASEAYLVDVPRPVKWFLPQYREAEEVLQRAVAERFGLEWPIPEDVHHADNVMLATEARALLKPSPAPWEELPEPVGLVILGLPPDQARGAFLYECERLGIR